MKKVRAFFAVIFVFFPNNSATFACTDFTTRVVGKTKNLRMNVNYRNYTLQICFVPKITKKNLKPKFIGFRYPKHFSSIGNTPGSKVLKVRTMIKGRAYIRAWRFQENKTYCLTLKLQKRVWAYKFNKRLGRYEKFLKSKKGSLQEYIKMLKRNPNLSNAYRNILWKIGRKGVTVGSSFFNGSSGAKGLSCGIPVVPWKNLRKQKPNVEVSDF